MLKFQLHHYLLQYLILLYDIYCKYHRIQYVFYIIVLIILYLTIQYEMNIWLSYTFFII